MIFMPLITQHEVSHAPCCIAMTPIKPDRTRVVHVDRQPQRETRLSAGHFFGHPKKLPPNALPHKMLLNVKRLKFC